MTPGSPRQARIKLYHKKEDMKTMKMVSVMGSTGAICLNHVTYIQNYVHRNTIQGISSMHQTWSLTIKILYGLVPYLRRQIDINRKDGHESVVTDESSESTKNYNGDSDKTQLE